VAAASKAEPDPNLSLSEERSARAEGARERWDAGRRDDAHFSSAPTQIVVLLPSGGLSVDRLRLDKSASVRCRALHLTRRHRWAAFADLSSDKERFG